METPRGYRYSLVCASILLLASQLTFLTAPGLEEDEALFVTPFLKVPPLYSWHVAGHDVPVMIMDYIGGLKSWLYWPIFRIFSVNVWSMRLPACAISILTLAVFMSLVRRVGGPAAASIAGLLLATDAVFVLTNVFDWGPVALLILATVIFLYCIVRFGESGKTRFLAAGALTAGLALWHKAIFVFPLGAMLLALMACYPSAVRRHWRLKNGAVAAVFLVLGSAPLIAFNLHRAGATWKASNDLPSVPLAEKLMMLRHTIDGRALEHYMFRAFPGEQIALTGAPVGDRVLGWYRQSHLGPGSALGLFLIASLLLVPLLSGSVYFRPLAFAWIALGVACGSMLLFRDAGAGPHHTVLLDPAPQFIVALTLAGRAATLARKSRWLLTGLVAAAIVSNLFLLANYHREARANGFSVFWTDGARNLAQAAVKAGLPVAVLDWGIHNGLQIETRNAIPVTDDPTPREHVLYVTHAAGDVVDESRAQQFEERLEQSGLRVISERTIPDRHGFAVFRVFELSQGDR
jgi:4-amino-4-deoxy-L-arabinose transferase-like glycosyltransferase